MSLLAHLQYIHPSSLAGGVGQLSADGGFAIDTDELTGDREGGLRLWEDKYQFQKDMLPLFVGEPFGRKVQNRMHIMSPGLNYFPARSSRRERA